MLEVGEGKLIDDGGQDLISADPTMIGFAQESYTIMEGQPTVTLTVTSNGVNRDTVVVVFSTLSGSAEGI